MKIRLLLIFLMVWAKLGSLPNRSAVSVHFNAASYQVATNGTVTLGILIDGDTVKAEDQPVSGGLFGFGIRLEFDPANAEAGRESLTVTPALDYSGLVPGAQVEEGKGFLVCRGNVALSAGGVTPFTGTNLLTIQLHNLASLSNRYSLVLASSKTATSGNVFVDGQGKSFDDQVTYGRAEVRVIPTATSRPPRLVLRLLESGALELTYPVAEGMNHFVEASEDLRKWADLFPLPRNDGRVLLKASERARYYRVRVLSKT